MKENGKLAGMCETLNSIPGPSKKEYKESPISPSTTSLNDFCSFKNIDVGKDEEKGEHLRTVGRNINHFSHHGQHGEATQNKGKDYYLTGTAIIGCAQRKGSQCCLEETSLLPCLLQGFL